MRWFAIPTVGVLCHTGVQWRAVHSDLKLRYEGLVSAGELRLDPHQFRAVEELDQLQRKLDSYQPSSPGLWQRVG